MCKGCSARSVNHVLQRTENIIHYMSRLLPITFILIFIPSLSIAGIFDSWQSSYKLQEARKNIDFKVPITTKREAIGFANSKSLFEKPPYDKLKEHGFNSWVVTVVKKEKAACKLNLIKINDSIHKKAYNNKE